MKACANFTSLQTDIGELTIVLRPAGMDLCEYLGTRRQLQEEGVIPPGLLWPEGFAYKHWESNGIAFSLVRQRPKGARGPRKMFMDCDYWRLRMEAMGRDYVADEIRKKEEELQKLRFQHSAAGLRAFRKNLHDLLSIHNDCAFQAFKDLVPALAGLNSSRRKATKIAAGENTTSRAIRRSGGA